MNTISKLGFAAAAMIASFGAPAQADTSQATIYVSANITAYCTLSGGNLFFGSLSDGSVDADAAADMTLYCTDGTPYTVTLDQGDNANGSDTRMKDINNNYIVYDLYSDSARTTALTYTAGSAQLATGTGTGGNTTLSVYGRIESTEVAAATSAQYYDSITVTVTY